LSLNENNSSGIPLTRTLPSLQLMMIRISTSTMRKQVSDREKRKNMTKGKRRTRKMMGTWAAF